MFYYDVCVSHKRATKILTYYSAHELSIGQLVSVPFGADEATGVVMKTAMKPLTATKSVKEKLWLAPLPGALIKTLLWLHEYYPSQANAVAQLVVPNKLVRPKKGIPGPNIVDTAANPLPPLTSDQKHVINLMHKGNKLTALLHGITGSGKTRIYIELIRQNLEKQKSVIVLSPEIGLTSQLFEEIATATSGHPLVLIHSGMTPAKRRLAWLQIAEATTPVVVIGPRSALFAPVRNLGLIVIDEAHDSSYKQQSQPYYQTSRVAAILAQNNHAKLVMGSATPLITDYYVFKEKSLPILKLQKLALQSDLTAKQIQIVDIKKRQNFKRSGWLSEQLLDAIDEQLSNKQQSLVFLNRRGTARLTLCSTCGWQAMCPRCDIPLTFHADNHTLLCHTCGHRDRVPSSCPVCHATEITFRSVGTKFITEELSRLFPQATIKRFDSDVKKSDKIQENFSDIKSGAIDILVGTQLLTKGWDLPNLGLIGLIVADSSLFFPDYSADEVTFQQINQAVGRVGRGHIPGKAVVQTYQPANKTIVSATTGDYVSFYESQIQERKLFHYPPFVYTMKIWSKRASRASIERSGKELADGLRNTYGNKIEILGPTPAFREVVDSKYVWQLVMKSKQRQHLVDIAKSLPSGWSYDLDPINLL